MTEIFTGSGYGIILGLGVIRAETDRAKAAESKPQAKYDEEQHKNYRDPCEVFGNKV